MKALHYSVITDPQAPKYLCQSSYAKTLLHCTFAPHHHSFANPHVYIGLALSIDMDHVLIYWRKSNGMMTTDNVI